MVQSGEEIDIEIFMNKKLSKL